jgi:hypothetical protein
MAEKEHIKGYSKDQALAKANEGTPFEKQNTATPQTPPVPDGANPEQAKSNANKALDGLGQIYDETKNKIGESLGFDQKTKDFWDQGCHGTPSNFLEAILAIIARIFDGFKDFDPKDPLGSILGKNDPNTVENLMRAYKDGNLTVGETKTFVGPDNKVYKYDTISRSGNTPTWVQMTSDGKEIQSVIMQESGYFAVYDYDQESGNYKKTSLDVSTQLARDLARGNPPPNFKQTTYQEFWETYKDKITEKLNGLILYGKTDHVVKDKDGNAVSAKVYYKDKLDAATKAFVEAISDEKGNYDPHKAYDALVNNKITFGNDGKVFIDMGDGKAPIREDILRRLDSGFYNAMQDYTSGIGSIYNGTTMTVNVVEYKGASGAMSSFDQMDLHNIEYANKHRDDGLQSTKYSDQLKEIKGMLRQVYGMSDKQADAMVKDVLEKQKDEDMFRSHGMGLAFEKGHAFYVTYQGLKEKVGLGQANEQEKKAYGEMDKFMQRIDTKRDNFENQIGLKLIFSNGEHTMRQYLGDGEIKLTPKTIASSNARAGLREAFLNTHPVDAKTQDQENHGVFTRTAQANIERAIAEQDTKQGTVGSSVRITINPKDLPTLNYLLQPGNEKELKEFIAKIADGKLGTKDLATALENIKLHYKQGEWDMKDGDTINFIMKENKEYTIAFGKDNGVIADINQGLDNDKLNQLVAHLNEAENIRAQERYNSLYTSSDTLSNR